jgi:hypothetical protein
MLTLLVVFKLIFKIDLSFGIVKFAPGLCTINVKTYQFKFSVEYNNYDACELQISKFQADKILPSGL